MSSFQDNFKRDTSGEDDELEYDDSAFYFFSLALLTFVALPLTLFILRSLIWGDVHVEHLPASCDCSWCRALRLIKGREARSNVFKKSFLYRCLLTGFVWYIWFLNYTTVMSLENI